MSHRHLLLAPLLATLAWLADPAAAQDVRQFRVGDSVDPQEVASILAAPEAGPAQPKMRSLRLLDGPMPVAKVHRELSLPVQFAFDSAEILPAARPQLAALAEGIRLLPGGRTVLIQGHTDATGSEQYNEALSQRRAQAVKRYLVAAHGIDEARLQAVGRGEQAPLPGHDPFAAENRRVQFRGE